MSDTMITRPTETLSPAERRASEDDRRWFARHPGRCLRLRDPFPGEAEVMAAACGVAPLPHHHGEFPLRVAVVCMNGHVRARTPLYTHLDATAPEATVYAVLRLLEANRAQDFEGPITKAELGEALGLTTVTRH